MIFPLQVLHPCVLSNRNIFQDLVCVCGFLTAVLLEIKVLGDVNVLVIWFGEESVGMLKSGRIWGMITTTLLKIKING